MEQRWESLLVSPSLEEAGTEIWHFINKERSWWGGWRQWSSSVLRSVLNSLANLWSPEHGQKDDICEPQQTSSWDPEGMSENIPPLECLWQISCRDRVGGEKGVGVGMCVAPGNHDSFSDVENREGKRMTEESLKKNFRESGGSIFSETFCSFKLIKFLSSYVIHPLWVPIKMRTGRPTLATPQGHEVSRKNMALLLWEIVPPSRAH